MGGVIGHSFLDMCPIEIVRGKISLTVFGPMTSRGVGVGCNLGIGGGVVLKMTDA